MLALEWKERAFIENVNSRWFCWFPAAILVHQNGAPIWHLHTKLYKCAWNVSPNNSETMGHKDLRLGQIVYILVFYNISFSWFLPLDGFQFNFLLRDSENDLYKGKPCSLYFECYPTMPMLADAHILSLGYLWENKNERLPLHLGEAVFHFPSTQVSSASPSSVYPRLQEYRCWM